MSAAVASAPPRSSWAGSPALRRAVFAVLAVVAGMAVQLTRSSRVPVYDSFWAEDGRFLYGEAKTHPFSATVFKDLGSYLQVPSRVVAYLVTLAPTRDAALVNALLVSFVCALLAIFVYASTDRVLPHRWQRFLAAALLVAHPAAAIEVNAANNNLHWFFMMAAFWACWSPATSRRAIAANTAVMLLAGLSDPLTGLLLPLVAWRAWRGSRSARWVTAGLVVALLMQYFLVLINGGPRQNGALDPAAIPGAYGLRIAGSFLVGNRGLTALWPDHGSGWWLPALSLLILGAGFAVAVRAARGHDRWLLVVAVGYSVAFLLAPLVTRGGAAGYLAHPLNLNGSRYTVVSLYLLFCALVMAAGLPAVTAVSSRLVPGLVGVFLLLQLATNYATPGPRTSGVDWRQEVAIARAGCAAGRTGPLPGELHGVAQPRIVGGVVELPVPPWGHYFWAVRLSCDQLS